MMRVSESISLTLRKTTAAIATWDESENPWISILEFVERPSHRGTEIDDS